MATVYPFRAWRVASQHATSVAAPPYDVLTRQEARELARDNPLSFLHVSKPEIDLPDTVPATDPQIYAQGAQALARLQQEGVLVQEPEACLYAYELSLQTHRQTGVALCTSVADYERNVIRRHEKTRPAPLADRTEHIEVLGAQTGMVFLFHRDSDAVAEHLAAVKQRPPAIDLVAHDGVRHRVWVIAEQDRVRALVQAFADLGPLYIADGHHRSAAAAQVAARRRQAGGAVWPEAPWEGSLAVSFPASQVQILAYHRVVRDLGALSSEAFLTQLRNRCVVHEGRPTAPGRGQVEMLLHGSWYTLELAGPHQEGSNATSGGPDCMDAELLQQRVLAPILGIADPRSDARLGFVGGVHGDAGLERKLEQGWAIAFKLHPVTVEDLLSVADAGGVMPPKSTWFEPKLRDGLLTHVF